ncbi:DUF3575 domain-containing protein [uncultured Aquimarina sp.]|uniref:DUF3575 domain-containing protein n=1 Tax=uncultured Aquimarina sp. TaxID=575652 RepID=UPI00260FFE94|nr:DUF3575 domain-containing protein [uncultured Aquimarina sp.]
MKHKLIVIVLLCTTLMYAQNTNTGTSKHLLKGNLLITPSLEYEKGVTNATTLSLQLGVELGTIENDFLDETRVVLYPTLDIDYRYYYNFRRRQGKGKNTTRNSANYFGLANSFSNANTVFSDFNPRDAYFITIAGVYGLQRTYWKKLNLRFEFGAGYGFSDIQETILPVVNFSLGWVLWNQS